MYKRIIITLLLLGISMGFYLLRAQPNTMFNTEKVSLGVGTGVQYCVLGVQGKYFFSDYLGAVASGSYLPYGALWNVGLEFRVPEIRPQGVSPYFNVFVGTNTFASLSTFFNTDPLLGIFESITEQDAFVGLTFSTGIKWDALNNDKGYFKIGFDYRFIPQSYVDYVDNFNARYSAFNSYQTLKFLPSIAYVFCISTEPK